MKIVRLIPIAAALGVLAGCQTDLRGGGPTARQQSGVEGEWASTDGISISRFTGGAFETVATDTGNRLSQGTYSFRDARTIDIQMTSLIRQTTTSVACALATPNQLNCTSASGAQFVLVRRAGVS